MKLTLDCLTKAGVWNDDRQVTHLTGTKEFNSETPGTQVVVTWIPEEIY
jgi:Holliday junction resolvase RusA-like endonuclease